MTTRDGRRLFLGLRGPLVDRVAVVIEIGVTRGVRLDGTKPMTHFLDLAGLAVRDLAVFGNEFLILAGPVDSTNAPFRIHRWRPSNPDSVQCTSLVYSWPEGHEHPEAICPLKRHGRDGLLVLYDSPRRSRINGSRYTADWIPVI